MTARVLGAIVTALLLQAPFRSGVDVVRVDVSVMRGGKPVAGLTAKNFTLTDNGVAQELTSATLDQLPLNAILVLDVSSSVAGEELAHLIDAGQQLVRSLRPDDRVALVTFSEQVLVQKPLTADVASIARALADLRGTGATSMNDAIHVALNLRPLDASRSIIIVFSDGEDNLSWTTPAGLVDEAKRGGTVIHAIEMRTAAVAPLGTRSAALKAQGYLDGVPVLQALATAAGGRVWSAGSSRDLRTLFTQALEEMRARYLLTYTPKGVAQDGWHDLKVTLKDARGDVTARPGYGDSPKGQ